ncbi:MAG: plasmid pRiA4b ORF-3 family protein [Rhodococcus sp.]|nr:plasmid pRiA4b ORF-3 family protein [Rhodococcus sp. (in: high G+C Gram-positive bacteria)]
MSLRDVEPEVWRRIVVRSEMPLRKLSLALERAMGWEGYHLHLFDVAGVLFGEPDEDADYMIHENAAAVKHLLPRVGASLRWDYDFGDGWEHDVVVEAIESAVDGKRYPVCLDGARACPPEDCGGTSGYERLLAALADPNDPEHERLVEWAPDGFDPQVFDLVAANRRLRAR